MVGAFKDLADYIRMHDGFGKPKINFQELYALFPGFSFTPMKGFGNYTNFGKAYESKNYPMLVSDGKRECVIIYREYQDTNENLAYAAMA